METLPIQAFVVFAVKQAKTVSIHPRTDPFAPWANG